MATAKRIFGSHPAQYAFLLGGGAFLVLLFGYLIWFSADAEKAGEFNASLGTAACWLFFGLGAFMWLAGGVVFGRNRGMSGITALLVHLLPVVGILLIAVLKRPLTPHEIWARDNPGLDTAESRRSYRPMKPLY